MVFTKCIDYFRELNAGSLSLVSFVQQITDKNDVINQPFSLDEIKTAVTILTTKKAVLKM